MGRRILLSQPVVPLSPRNVVQRPDERGYQALFLKYQGLLDARQGGQAQHYPRRDRLPTGHGSNHSLNSVWHRLGSSYDLESKPKGDPPYLFLISGSRLQVAGLGLEPRRLTLYAKSPARVCLFFQLNFLPCNLGSSNSSVGDLNSMPLEANS